MENVWLGVSAEDNQWFDRRTIALSDVPGDFVRFVSAEPLLSEVAVTKWALISRMIDWVIVGGESGPGCRPMDIQWARNLRDVCGDAGVAFYLKQLGGHPNKRVDELAVLDGRTHTELPQRGQQ